MVGEHWKVVSETTRDEGTVNFQLLSNDLHLVMIIVDGNPDNLNEISFNFSVSEGMVDADALTRIALMATIFSRFSGWSEEEIGRWFGRGIQIGVGTGDEDDRFTVQKDGQKLWMTPIACEGGTVFITGVRDDPTSNAPTLEEWMAKHPAPPPKSGKTNYHSYQTSGKVNNASFRFKNFSVRMTERHFIGEMENLSGQKYQMANFS